MRRLIVVLSVIFSFVSLSSGVEPEELESMTMKELLLFYDLEELTSVSFFPAVARKAPGFSYVITTEQIEQSPARTLSDIIAMRVPGMTTGGHERHGPLIGTRGVFIDNNAKTMVMLDEQQINQRSHFGYTVGLLSPLLGDIKQVEVILGPGAILHGSGALNGFINLVPRNGKDNPGAFVNSEYGFAEQLWKIEAGYGASYGDRRNVYLYGGMYGAEGYEPDDLYGYTKTFDVRANGFDPGNYRLSMYWNHDNFNLNIFSYENNPYKNGTYEAGWFHQQTLGIRPKYLFEISDTDSIELTGSMLWFDHSSPGLVPSTGLTDDRGGSERHWELKNIYRTTRWDRHSLAGGFSYGQKHFFEKRQFFGDDAVIGLAAMDTQWQEASVFAEDVINLTDRWTASFGLRYDKIYLSDMSNEIFTGPKTPNEISGHFSPRIATAYELDPDTTIKASYQHGFRTPDVAYYLWNLFYKDAAESLGYSFPTLDIETMDSYELNFQKNFPEKKIKVNCNLFYNVFKDLLSFNFYKDTDLFTPEQIQSIKDALGLPPPVVPGSFLNEKEKVKVWGGEIAVVLQPLSNTEARISYGYVHSNADQVRYPEHQIKVNTLSYFQNNRLSLGLNYLFNSRYSEADLSRAHSIYRNDRHVADVSLNYKVSPDFSIGVIAQNVFENNVPPMVFEPDRLDKGGLGHDERRIYLSLRLKL